MVIGSGLLANAFASFSSDKKVCIFASGVSRSNEIDQNAYQRELNLLLKQETDQRFVYFSTCGIFDPSLQHALYIQHKIKLERLIQDRFKEHLILRLPNVVGRTTNPFTLTNFIRDRIVLDEPFEVHQNATRYILDVDDIIEDLSPLIKNWTFSSFALNVCGNEPVELPKLVCMMEMILKKKAHIDLVEKGASYQVDNSALKRMVPGTRVARPGLLDLPALLEKYYGSSGSNS